MSCDWCLFPFVSSARRFAPHSWADWTLCLPPASCHSVQPHGKLKPHQYGVVPKLKPHQYGVVPKGLLTFLGRLGNADFSLNSGSHKKVCSCFMTASDAVVFMTACDAMDFFCLLIVSCSWDKILYSNLRTQSFWKEEKNISGGLSLEAIYQNSGSSFCAFFAKSTKES